MSYIVTILRTKDGHQDPISQAEVENAVASMPDLKIVSDAHWDFIISLLPHGDRGASLIFKNGEIFTKNPKDETMQIMMNLADKLNARVRGDEFETYRTPSETYTHPDDINKTPHPPAKLKQWRISGVVLGIFVILALLVGYFSAK